MDTNDESKVHKPVVIMPGNPGAQQAVDKFKNLHKPVKGVGPVSKTQPPKPDVPALSPVEPTRGRIVIFVPRTDDLVSQYNDQKDCAAIIVRAWRSHGVFYDEINLRTMPDGDTTEWKTNVPYSEKPVPYSWHWPAKV